MTIAAPPVVETDIFYPDGDGKPMAESDVHLQEGMYAIAALQSQFEARDDAYVAGNNFIYFLRNRPRACVSPDCYIVFGVQKGLRKSYKVWEENYNLPAFVLELTSDTTRNEDTERKFNLYQDILGVSEYFLFDPTGDYLNPRVIGYRLVDNRYVPIAADGQGRLYSEQLNLYISVEDEHLRLFDPVRGENLLSPQEIQRRAESDRKRFWAELEALTRETEARKEEQA